MEEFGPVTEDELDHYARMADHLFRETDQALFCTFSGLTFGDIALVPAGLRRLKNPKGIRDIEEWYISTRHPPGLHQGCFRIPGLNGLWRNLDRLYRAVGVIFAR